LDNLLDKNTFSKKNEKRHVVVSKTMATARSIGTIEKNTDTFILTFGQFNLIDALVEILNQSGEADVSICTWTAANAHLRHLWQLLESKKSNIRTLRLVVDRSFEGRQPEYCHNMRRMFGSDCIRAIRAHAKFLLVRSKTHDIVVRTSMNLNNNPRLENIEVSENEDFADFFQVVFDEIFDNVKPGDNHSQLAGLLDLPDSYPFKEVAADYISEKSVNDVEAEYTLEKL